MSSDVIATRGSNEVAGQDVHGPVINSNIGGRVDYGAVVLSRILPHRYQELEYAVERLSLDHFTDAIHRTLWQILVDFWTRYGEIFPSNYLVDLLQSHNVEAGKILVLSNAYESYVQTEVTEGQFRAAVDSLRDYLDRFQTGKALTLAYDILERGIEHNGETLTGHRAAREFFLSEVAEIEDRDADDQAPEGDIRGEADRLIQLYQQAHSQPEAHGVEFGITPLDREIGGVQPGELCLIAAYSSQGKSQVCAQVAWHTAVKQRRGVYFATTETVRDTTIRRILSRHSREPKFGLPDGLNAKDIQRGSLSSRDERVYFDVVQDFSTNAAMVHIAQMPSGATLEHIQRGAARINRVHRVDALIIDYLQLLKGPIGLRSEREVFNSILRDAKVMSNAFDNGRGVAVISPWQVKQDAYRAALEAQSYVLGALADTSEADKSPDLIVALLLLAGEDRRLAKMQTLKHRDGPVLAPFDVEVDYRTSFLGDHGGGADRPAGRTREDDRFAALTGGI